MSVPLTTNGLIASIKRKAAVPNSQETFQEQDFIDLMNEEFSIYIVPVVLKQHQEYYAYSEEESLVTGQNRYKIPYRSIGNKLRDLHYKNDAGQLVQMAQVSPDNRSFNNEFYNEYAFTQFFIEGDDIVIVSRTIMPGKLVKSYYLRPNQLVSEDRATKIQSIDRNTGEIVVDQIPSIFVGSDVLIDFIGGKSPNINRKFDVAPTLVNTVTSTFTFNVSDIPATLAVGDYVMLAGETIVPQVPTELVPLLTQRIAVKCLEAQGDTEALKNAEAELAKIEANVSALINNRVEGAPLKISNRRSILRTGIMTRYRRF